ncbi:hypothetical protein [Algoriphagus sp.]|uniref:hypothetical protein n=1 Tax=Algoriphagus sp. TaxID=1872435 RepID=UPI0025EEE54B|nr:hypothetical protein [Algoriphagus sp.]
MHRLLSVSFFLISLFVTSNLTAQNFYKEKISRDQILTIGFGPSFAYIDNGGQYRSFNFEFRPSFSAAYTKRLTPTFDLRATTGIQGISSGGNPSSNVKEFWTANNSSFTAKGNAIYFDVMPSVNLMPFSNHMNRSFANLYGGFGFGFMYTSTKQTKSFDENEVPEKSNLATAYLPFRAGLSFQLGAYSDIAAEGTLMLTFTDNMDGNVGFNRFGDHLGQVQIVYRRYLYPRID